MSIWQKAVETYDYHSHLAGKASETQHTLVPISHMISKASFEITINEYGDFLDAKAVLKDEAKTIIPATEASAGRTAAACPHPLSDQLIYVSPYGEIKYQMYIEQLTNWAESEFSHPKVRAILAYAESGTIIDDLFDSALIELGENGRPLEKYDKLIVRWRVVNTGEKDACYEDTTLFDSFIDYYRSLQCDAEKWVCLVSGEKAVITQNHPKGVIPLFGNAKLISANDSSNFTYKGRFTDSQQAATVSYEASQKAHNALSWLIANQGILVGGRMFVCWNPHGSKTPLYESGVLTNNYSYTDDENAASTPSEYKEQLSKTLKGWQQQLPEYEDVVIASFDAATTGRLSITYYNELKGSDFINRLEFWQEHCCWENHQFGYQSPSIQSIIGCAFGSERDGKLSVDDRIMREQVQRLFHCVIDRTPIPQDIVMALLHKASNPLAYDPKAHNRNKVIFTACAVIYAYRTVSKKEAWKMALEKDKKDRSYQFGRLLAVMEKVERDTYDRSENREPNAIRMQSVFCERPMYASRIIHDSLNPYFAKLSPGMRIYYNNLIGEIFENISQFSENELNRQLEDSYLLGYYLQRNSLYTKKENTSTDENEEEN